MSRDGQSSAIASAAGAVFIGGVLAFLLLPMLVVAGASLGSGDVPYVSFPPHRLSLYWYANVPARYWDAVGVSLIVATGTAVVSCALAIPAALGLVRARFAAKPVIAILLRAPLQMPYVVVGIAFLQSYYLIAGASGLQLRASYSGLILGHTFLATPYAIGSIVAVLSRFNIRLEEAASSLGATPWRVFRRVTLPIILPGVYAGGLYAFIVSFGEVPVALFLGGPGRTTFPVEMFASMQFDFSPALLAVSTVMLLVSFLVLLVVQRLLGVDALMRPRSTR